MRSPSFEILGPCHYNLFMFTKPPAVKYHTFLIEININWPMHTSSLIENEILKKTVKAMRGL